MHPEQLTNTKILKTKDPNYFKNYYLNNKGKYNHIKTKTQWYGIEIFGTTYIFDRKIDMNIMRMTKQDLKKPNCVFVKSDKNH